jgi:hypothetical protein
MSTDHIEGEHNAGVVPLRAADAGTEIRAAESTGPAYTDLSDGRTQRKPVIPAHWQTWEAACEHVKLAAARARLRVARSHLAGRSDQLDSKLPGERTCHLDAECPPSSPASPSAGWAPTAS